jgi:hypothetical protein
MLRRWWWWKKDETLDDLWSHFSNARWGDFGGWNKSDGPPTPATTILNLSSCRVIVGGENFFPGQHVVLGS